MTPKHPSESLTVLTDLVLPSETNALNNLFGGELLVSNGRTFGLYGAVFSSITLLMLLFGQRLAKDYDGARTIVIYFIPAVMAVYWLN